MGATKTKKRQKTLRLMRLMMTSKSNRGKMATTSCWFSHCIIFAL
jgi:hypothetical protein